MYMHSFMDTSDVHVYVIEGIHDTRVIVINVLLLSVSDQLVPVRKIMVYTFPSDFFCY